MDTQNLDEIKKKIIKKVTETNASNLLEVSKTLTLLEEYLRIPYDSPQFYEELQNVLGYLASNHALLLSGPQVDANLLLIKQLLTVIVARRKKLQLQENMRSVVNEDPILRVMNEEGEVLPDISVIQPGTKFVLADKRQLVNMLIWVKAVLDEKTTEHTVEKTITISQWNPNTASWEVMAGERSLLQTVIAGKTYLIYADSIANVLQLTENQQLLVNGTQ